MMSQYGGIFPVSNAVSNGVLKGLSAFNEGYKEYRFRKMQNQVDRLYKMQLGKGGGRRMIPRLHQTGGRGTFRDLLRGKNIFKPKVEYEIEHWNGPTVTSTRWKDYPPLDSKRGTKQVTFEDEKSRKGYEGVAHMEQQQWYKDWVESLHKENERLKQQGRGRKSRFTSKQQGGSVRDVYALGGRARMMTDNIARKDNDGSWFNRSREMNVAPMPGTFHGTTDVPFCKTSGCYNCMLRHIHDYGFPPVSRSSVNRFA